MEVAIDPSFESQPPAPNHGVLPDPANTAKFSILQKLNRLNLVRPVGEDQMYFAAMNSRTCRLAVLGLHYWRSIDRPCVGLEIARSTLATWVGQRGVRLQPLVDALKAVMLRSTVLHADETPVAMLKPGNK